MQPSYWVGVFDSKFLIMKKVVGIVVLIISVFVAHAQQSETRSVGSFKGVKSGEAIDVYLRKGDKESVKVETTGISLSDVKTEVTDGYLRIYMRSGNYRGNRNVKVYVTYVSLERISVSSASNLFSDGEISGSKLSINVSSAASVELTLNYESVKLDVSSAGDVTLEGKAKALEVEVSSAGEVDAYNLESEMVEVNASSAGSAKVNAVKEIVAQASSGASIRYRGNPSRTNSNASSGGSIKKSN